jgi:hypothetical protein
MTATSTPVPTEIAALLDRLDPQFHATCDVEGCTHHPAAVAYEGAVS